MPRNGCTWILIGIGKYWTAGETQFSSKCFFAMSRWSRGHEVPELARGDSAGPSVSPHSAQKTSNAAYLPDRRSNVHLRRDAIRGGYERVMEMMVLM